MTITNSSFISEFLEGFPDAKNKLQSTSYVTADLIANDGCVEKNKFTDVDIWNNVKNKLHKFFGEKVFKSWLESLNFTKLEGDQIFFSVPTGFIKEWIMTNYSSKMLEFWQLESNKEISRIEILVKSQNLKDKNNSLAKSNINREEKNKINDNLSAPLDRRRTFETFVVGKSNELAFAAAKRVAESNKPVIGNNPLFLYGGVGLGKTHLMHAVAWYIKENHKGRRVIYLSAERFMYQYITALKNKEIMHFKQLFRSVDVLMVDDVQFISGKESTQEEFFHTFNTLVDQNKQLVISADRSPSDLQGVEERIKSRLAWGLVADINNTTFELRVGILQVKLEQIGVSIPRKIIEFIAHHIISNVRELEGALNKVIANSVLIDRAISLDSVKEILADLLRTNAKSVSMDDVLIKVSEYLKIKISDLKSDRRLKNISYARQVAMYLSKTLTQFSLLEIGKFFGGRDHATVIHAVKKIECLMKYDPQVMEDINSIIKKLK